jgi:hypothetical protein
MKNEKSEKPKVSLPIPKPSNNWLEEFDCNAPASRRVRGSTDQSELTKKSTHEKYASDRDKYRRR